MATSWRGKIAGMWEKLRGRPDLSGPLLDDFFPLRLKVEELARTVGVNHPDYQAAYAAYDQVLKLRLERGMVEDPDED